MEAFAKICFIVITAVHTVGILAGLIRAIRGPRRADRILGINMIGSLSTAVIAVLAVSMKESWLLDVSLVYGMMSFLSVVVLARIHIATSAAEKREGSEKAERADGASAPEDKEEELI